MSPVRVARDAVVADVREASQRFFKAPAASLRAGLARRHHLHVDTLPGMTMPTDTTILHHRLFPIAGTGV